VVGAFFLARCRHRSNLLLANFFEQAPTFLPKSMKAQLSINYVKIVSAEIFSFRGSVGFSLLASCPGTGAVNPDPANLLRPFASA
jgi:hypothetical protein